MSCHNPADAAPLAKWLAQGGNKRQDQHRPHPEQPHLIQDHLDAMTRQAELSSDTPLNHGVRLKQRQDESQRQLLQ